MNPIGGQKLIISIPSNCGNVTDSYKNMLKNREISMVDEKHTILEWLSLSVPNGPGGPGFGKAGPGL